VFALQKQLNRGGDRRYTRLSVGDKVRMQFDSMVSTTKKTVLKTTNLGTKLK
jgi:hypothetical protein